MSSTGFYINIQESFCFAISIVNNDKQPVPVNLRGYRHFRKIYVEQRLIRSKETYNILEQTAYILKLEFAGKGFPELNTLRYFAHPSKAETKIFEVANLYRV